MGQIWRWWKQDSSKYGEIDPQVIRDADHGKISKFVSEVWTVDELQEALEYQKHYLPCKEHSTDCKA